MNERSESQALSRALFALAARDPGNEVLCVLLSRLFMEVEALREALASREVPESVRAAYRASYARTAVLSRNAAGPTGGDEKVLRRFYPPGDGPHAGVVSQLERLGLNERDRETVVASLEEVAEYT